MERAKKKAEKHAQKPLQKKKDRLKAVTPDLATDVGPELPPPGNWIDKQIMMQNLHVSSGTLRNWRNRGLIPFSRIGAKIYYHEQDVHKLLLQCRKHLTKTPLLCLLFYVFGDGGEEILLACL